MKKSQKIKQLPSKMVKINSIFCTLHNNLVLSLLHRMEAFYHQYANRLENIT